MKRFFTVVAVLGMLFATSGCSGDKNGDQAVGSVTPPGPSSAAPGGAQIMRTVTPQEAQAMIAQRKDLVVIDVRNPEELKEGFIAGSQLTPFWEIAKGQRILPTDHPLLLVCAVGGRSYAVGQYLYQKGYREVYNLQGGIDNWKRSGLPLQYP